GATPGPGARGGNAGRDPRQHARAADVPGSEPVSLLVLDDVHTYDGEAHILQGVSLTVGEGEVLTLIGRNGAGKTTTLRSIMGIARTRRGHVRLRGEDITALETHDIAPRGIAWIPEERRVLTNLPGRENRGRGAPVSPGAGGAADGAR